MSNTQLSPALVSAIDTVVVAYRATREEVAGLVGEMRADGLDDDQIATWFTSRAQRRKAEHANG